MIGVFIAERGKGVKLNSEMLRKNEIVKYSKLK